MINARAETVAQKPAYRRAFANKRCIIPADGFYEWRSDGGKSKTPMFIRLEDGSPFAFAGLWEGWNAPDGSRLLSCAIITTPEIAREQRRLVPAGASAHLDDR